MPRGLLPRSFRIDPTDPLYGTSGIYIIISPSAKVYIGQSIDVHSRIADYKTITKSNQVRLMNSFKKYGFNSHFIDVMEYCPIEMLNERERFWQDEYQVLGMYGLNCKLTGTFDKSGKHSEETKEKIRQSMIGKVGPNKGKVLSDEQKKKISDAIKGRKLSKEHRDKIGAAHKGRKQSEDVCKERSELLKGRIPWNKGVPRTEEEKEKIRQSRLKYELSKN